MFFSLSKIESGDWKIKYFLSLYQKERKKYKEYFEIVQTQVPKPNRSSEIDFLGPKRLGFQIKDGEKSAFNTN